MSASSESVLQIAPVDPRSPEAAELMHIQSSEISERYDSTGDGFSPFKPEDILGGRGLFLLGRIGERAVACGAFRPLEEKITEIKRMFVRPEFRGRGYARAILAELERRAAQFGYEAARLETGDRQPEAIALYHSCGYHLIESFGIYATDSRSICFEKRLNS